MLEIDLKSHTNLGAHEILHPLNKNENFRCTGKDYELYAYDRRAAQFGKVASNEFSSYIFYLLICTSKLTDMCLRRAQKFQMVGLTRNTPNGFDVLGNGDLPPPPPMTPVETFMATQTEVLCQILQTQQQIAQQMHQRPPVGANQDGPQMVTTYS
jgi:hypothetical protein